MYSNLTNLAFSYKTAITIGNFDGVHLGHSELIKKTIEISKINESIPMVFTFSNHPLEFLYNKHINYITSFSHKVKIIENMGINDIISIPFTNEIKNMSTEEFSKEILLKKLNSLDIVMGFDSRLGSGRQGSVEYLYEIGKQIGFNVHIVEPVTVDNMRVSSSYIRELIKVGEVKNVQRFLGRKYMIEGKIKHGKKIGRKLGFPTANLDINSETLIPKIGVYVCKAEIDGLLYDAAVSIGYNPTINEYNQKQIFIEAHIIDFNEDIYCKNMKLFFYDRFRDEMKFDSLEELIIQLNKDIMKVKNYNFT